MKTAHAIEKFKRIERVALETLLDIAATMTLLAGFVCSAIFILLAVLGLEPVVTIGLACLSAICTVVGWGILSAAAEHLRVGKSSAGLEYSGEISGTHLVPYMACSECGARLLSLETCQCCGAEIAEATDESNVAQ